MRGVDWQPWSAAGFARARQERKPVLLAIAAPWCAASLEMARTTYADSAVCAVLASRFVSIQVDADRRPDIAERYSLGGLPTTALLDGHGAIIGGGTLVAPERMLAALTRAADAIAAVPSEPRPLTTVDAAGPRSGAADSDDELVASTFATFDVDHGGFGTAPKFPLTGPIELALSIYRESRNAHMAHVVESTLDAMGWGELFDDVDGGFFRCADSHDWRRPRREKLLDVNAALLRVYVDASDALRIARFGERAGDILRYVQTWLADQADGGWAASQRADDDYYTAPTAEERRTREPPPVDGTLFSGWNALMAAAALRASLVLHDPDLGAFALRSLERVLLDAYSPGAGVAHYVEQGRAHARGLLDDQVAMTTAQLDAYEATGNVVYEMMARELMLYALRTMWDDERGGFFDRSVPDEDERIGLMASRLKPFVTNCEAARVLRRLADVSGQREFAERADATLAQLAPAAAMQGPLAAHYLLARANR